MGEITILQLIKGLDIGGKNGGDSRFCLDLSKQLAKIGYRVILCNFFVMNTSSEKRFLKDLENSNIKIIQLVNWSEQNKYFHYLQSIRKLEGSLKHREINIIQSHFQLGAIASIYLKAKNRNVKILRTVHNIKEYEEGTIGLLKRSLFAERIYPAKLDAEVGVSQAIVEQLRAHPAAKQRPEKIYLIHNAIDLPEALPEIKPPKVESEGFIIGSAGRLAEQKGYRFLLAAMPEVLKAIPGCELHLAGEGEQKAELKAIADELGIASQVKFRGYLGNIPEFLNGIDLFVSSSLWEGLPTAILEAIMAGVPVLATDISGNRELIQDGKSGWLVQPSDAQALASGILQAYQHPELRQQFAQEARAILPQFSIQTVAEQYAQLYQQLLAGAARASL